MNPDRIESLLRAGPTDEPLYVPVALELAPASATKEAPLPRHLERVRVGPRERGVPAVRTRPVALVAALIAATALAVLVAVFLGAGGAPLVADLSPSPSSTATESTRTTESVAPSPTPGASPRSAVIPWIDASPTPAATATDIPIPPGTPACTAADLRATMLGWDGAGGQVFGLLGVVHIGASACRLEGPARRIALVSGLPSNRHPLDSRFVPDLRAGPGSQRGSVAPALLLEPGDDASLVFLWSNWCGGSFNHTTVEFTLAGGEGILLPGPGRPTGIEPARCDSPSGPSEIVGYAFRVVSRPVGSHTVPPRAAAMSPARPRVLPRKEDRAGKRARTARRPAGRGAR